MVYLMRYMLCKMIDVERKENYVTTMMLPSRNKEDLMLLMLPLLLYRMSMMKVLL